VIEERPLTDADREARVLRDVVVKLGSSDASKRLMQNLRLIEIEKIDEPSKRMRQERSVRETIILVTDRLDLSADLVALLYSARWKIEIFFRWLKCTLGCKTLLAESQDGVRLQLYSALIASLLISLWLGKKPTKRTFEAICFYLLGMADVEDVLAGVRRLKPHPP
jgi:IS4 transposase